MLEMEGVSFAVADRHLLSEATLSVARGESVAVVGPSGAGKSTLLSLCLGLLKPQQGSIKIDGVDIVQLSVAAAAQHRAEHVGMVFQFGELLDELSPIDNVLLPRMLQTRKEKNGLRSQAKELLAELGLGALPAYSSSLSGGERQRVGVARALINAPGLVLADEPTGSLDEESSRRVADLLFELPARRDIALLVVTHDQDVAARADRIVRLSEGRLIQHGIHR